MPSHSSLSSPSPIRPKQPSAQRRGFGTSERVPLSDQPTQHLEFSKSGGRARISNPKCDRNSGVGHSVGARARAAAAPAADEPGGEQGAAQARRISRPEHLSRCYETLRRLLSFQWV